ncbi:MAG: cation transporter [Candidatus Rokubacteria bacterium]|nr:cation transporter [Candidatus Rokubacteria bacterium]
MDTCCEVRPVEERQRRVLRVVLWINLAMFVLELGAGLIAHSTALLADSVDMLGDAVVYGFSLYVIGRGGQWQARGALLKGTIMAAFAAGIAVEVALKLARGVTPNAELMTGTAVMALAANGAVLIFLSRHRADDLNMRSAWLCSRNDVISNTAVVCAALAVALTGSAWPDIMTGAAIAGLFAWSSLAILREALKTRRRSISTSDRAGSPQRRAHDAESLIQR